MTRVALLCVVSLLLLASSGKGVEEFEDRSAAGHEDALVIDVVDSEEPFGSGCDDTWRTFASTNFDWDSYNRDMNSRMPSHRAIARKVRPWLAEARSKNTTRLYCGTYTHHKKHEQAALMHSLWGVRCDRHQLFTDRRVDLIDRGVPDASVVHLAPIGGESYMNMWQKTRALLMYLAEQVWVRDFDFFLFGGDDVFVIPENIRRLVQEADVAMLHRAGAPLYFGYRHRPRMYDKFKRPLPIVDERFATSFVSGAGYVLNIQALLVVATLIKVSPLCFPDLGTFHEDLTLSQCLGSAGIPARDSRDAFGEDRFIVLSPKHMSVEVRDPSYSWWWRDYRDRGVPSGLDVVSESAVLFHFIDSDYAPELSRLIYDEHVS